MTGLDEVGAFVLSVNGDRMKEGRESAAISARPTVSLPDVTVKAAASPITPCSLNSLPFSPLLLLLFAASP